MAGQPEAWRELVEDKSFTYSLGKLGGAEAIEPALAALAGPLSTKPEGFPIVLGSGDIRLAKTIEITTWNLPVPALRLWFRIAGKGTVHLLWVEVMPDENDSA